MEKIIYCQKFGNLEVIGLSLIQREGPNPKPIYICRCKCGKVIELPEYELLSGHRKSCGCLHKKYEKPMKGRLYEIWKNMRRRCNDPKNKRWENYGGRGIKVCDEWNDYLTFRTWAYSNGYSDNLTIDRIDINKGYSPTNCRWANAKMQANNTTRNHLIEYQGNVYTMAEFAEFLGISYSTLQHRIDRGWDIERIVSQPQRRR